MIAIIKYLVQQGVDGACIYWNSQREDSRNIMEVAQGGWEDRSGAERLRDVWDDYGKHRSTFKVVEVEVD